MVTVEDILKKKKNGEKIVMLTAYDYPLARALDEGGVDIVLVGDTVANVVLGLDKTTEVGMTEMIHHAKAARRGVNRALLVGDMPYDSYQKTTSDAVDNAKRFVEDAGCGAVKLEWFSQCPDVVEKIVGAGIAVMGHVGLTPQTAQNFRVQGKDAASAKEILRDALILQDKGCFSIVLECVPAQLAEVITKKLDIPTIGIGAGPFCDGQVLVTHDMLGLFDRFHPKFVKQYVDLNAEIGRAVAQFSQDVQSGEFPAKEQSFFVKGDEWKKLNEEIS